MKILIIVPELFTGAGGIKVFNSFLVKALKELGHTVNVVSINDRDNSGSRDYQLFCSGGNGYLRRPKFIINTLCHVTAFKPDILFCCHINFSPLCLMISKIFNIPYITITHGIEAWNIRGLKLRGIKSSGKIISVSRFTRGKILEQIKDYKEENVVIIPNTFDSERFKPAPKPQYLMERWNIKKEDRIILTVARLSKAEQYKGYDKVIQAMNEILREIPEVKYMIVGDGDDKERIKKLISDMNLQDRVTLVGYVPDEEIADYYNLCDVFVMPSKGEGFGIVFLEAIACGKPVIAGNKDGSVDALMDGDTGVLVDPDNVEDIKKGVVNILYRNTQQKFYDADYLRRKVIDEYGYERFSRRVKDNIGTL